MLQSIYVKGTDDSSLVLQSFVYRGQQGVAETSPLEPTCWVVGNA